jgi:hypothetical protein
MLDKHLLLRRQGDFAVGNVDRLVRVVVRAAGNFFEALLQNAHALAHFLHAHEVAVVAIADRADRNVEFQILVAQIRLVLAQIPFHAAAAQVRAAQAVINRHLLGDHAEVAHAVHPDAVAREQRFVSSSAPQIRRRTAALIAPARRHIAHHAADARVAGGQAARRSPPRPGCKFFRAR